MRRIRRSIVIVVVLGAASVAVPFVVIDRAAGGSKDRGAQTEGITDALARRLPPGHATTTFADATAAFGVEVIHGATRRASLLPEDMGPGCALEDLDGDGDLDLFFVGFAGNVSAGAAADAVPPEQGRTHRLLRNDGGRFTDVTRESGVGFRDYGIGVAVGDTDGDGRLDLYVSCYGSNRLLRNLGGLRFEDVTTQARVGDSGFGAGCAFSDVDHDGDLDLYVCNYVEFRWDGEQPRESEWGGYTLPYTINPSSFLPAPNRFYLNRGDGKFDEVAEARGVHDPRGRSLACTFADFSGDGRPDLYVLNDVSKNAYFENTGAGAFEDRSLTSCAADYRGAMGNAVADIDGDGDLDLFITHWLAQENAIYINLLRERNRKEPGTKPVIFGDQADFWGLGASALNFVGWGCAFFDYDLDGALDLCVVNGSTKPSHDPERLTAQRPQLFWHRRGDGFFEVGGVGGTIFEEHWNARGLADGDLDGDGDQDLVITANHGPVRVLENLGPCGGWLAVRLRQPRGNRFAVGALVTVTTPDGAVTQEVGAGTSYLCHRPLLLTFGLAAHPTADVTVRWPDGKTTREQAVLANRVLELSHDPR